MRTFALAMILAAISHLALASEAKTEAKVPADDGPVITKSKCPTCEADGVQPPAGYRPEEVARAVESGKCKKIDTKYCPVCEGSGYVITLPNGTRISAATKKQERIYRWRKQVLFCRERLAEAEKGVKSAKVELAAAEKELAEAEAAESAALKEAEDAKPAKDF